ncbi:MAG: hypothetical protein AAGJ46_14490 [Planctomycetota bacterium]
MGRIASLFVLSAVGFGWPLPASMAEAPAEFAQLQLAVAGAASESGPTPLLIHFHGNAELAEASFRRSGLDGVLVAINCRGLSSAYRRPFENPELFDYLLRHVTNTAGSKTGAASEAAWEPIRLSCFSAGYGAVREVLKREANRERIDAVLAADSIYASIHSVDGQRRVDATQMAPFLEFARLAIGGEKRFLVTHSQLPVEPYASTVETADYLLAATGLTRKELPALGVKFTPISRASSGGFTVLGYPGADGEAHLQHLREIASLWRMLREKPPAE